MTHKTDDEIMEAVFKANLRAYEILHKYAMQTKNTHALDLLEAAQKEIINTTMDDLAAKDTEREKAVEEIMQDLIVFRDEIPEAYGWGEEDKEADRGYQICSQLIKAELTKFIDKRLTTPNN